MSEVLDHEHQNMIVADFDRATLIVRDSFMEALAQYKRPSAIFRPKLYPDGDEWCALYGDNLQSGVCGFGSTPEQAMIQFDIQFLNEKPTP